MDFQQLQNASGIFAPNKNDKIVSPSGKYYIVKQVKQQGLTVVSYDKLGVKIRGRRSIGYSKYITLIKAGWVVVPEKHFDDGLFEV